jgi:L-ornithine N5-oxygenase
MSANDSEPASHLLGIGFGPSNLALAIALREHAARVQAEGLRYEFIEKQPRFGWHRGMLIDGATMQVHFVKDLVTMRDPTSRYSFLYYLHMKNRLPEFLNHKTFYPTRLEFHDYLEWAAEDFTEQVSYGQEAVSIMPVMNEGRVTYLDVVTRGTGAGSVHRTRNLVIACGLRPHMPDGLAVADDVWHNSQLLIRLAGLDEDRPWTFAVVGAGQSAAEVVEYLHRRFRHATIVSVFGRYGFSPADSTPFVNGIFDPKAVDTFYYAPQRVKRMLLDYHGNTNYSAVDIELIDELYRRVYAEQVTGPERLKILNTSKLADVGRVNGRLRLTVRSLTTGELTEFSPDVMICATGYRPAAPEDLLGGFASYCETDDQGGVVVDRSYRVSTRDDVDCSVYLQGPTEHVHGISASLLSTTAIRAGEIGAAVVAEYMAGECAQPLAVPTWREG